LRRYAAIVGPRGAGAPPAGAVSIVRATIDDEPALRAALYEAVCWREAPSRPPIEEVLSQPPVEVYLESWGRTGDLGFVAEDASGHRGGAEVSMGLERSWRGLGFGRRLLEHLRAAAIHDGIPRLSLSVELSNLRAIRLYEHFGYVPRGIIDTSRTIEVPLLPETIATITHGGA
jgi:ribosomal protein S18 acetylase RimI-like enzyme